MKYNLTDSQREAARWIVSQARSKAVEETFHAAITGDGRVRLLGGKQSEADVRGWQEKVTFGQLDALATAQMLRIERPNKDVKTCTLARLIYSAVDSDFAEDEPASPNTEATHPHPPEIGISLERFREKFPDPKRTGFLIMRFGGENPYPKIAETIKAVGQRHGLTMLRADDYQFHDNLLDNVRTYLHGCGFGVAVYDRIQTDVPNANIGLEVGYLMAMNKPVLLLKDKTVAELQADLAGRLYRKFDPYDPAGTIPEQVERWLLDNGIVVAASESLALSRKSNQELQAEVLTFVAGVRQRLTTFAEQESEHRTIVMAQMSSAPDEVSKNRIWTISGVHQEKARSDLLSQYEAKRKIVGILFRDELLKRVPPHPASVSSGVYEHPTNPLGIGMVADDLELMARLL